MIWVFIWLIGAILVAFMGILNSDTVKIRKWQFWVALILISITSWLCIIGAIGKALVDHFKK